MSRLSFKRRFILVVTVCALAAFLASPVHATTIKKLTLEELTAEANVIVKGTVMSVTSQWEEEETVIYTYVSVSVDEYVKGSGPKEVTIKHIGGTVRETGLYIEGAPEFEQGEKVLLYLRPSMRRYDSTYFEVVGLSQGKVALETSQEVAFGVKNDYVLLVLLMPLLFLPALRLKKLRRKNVFRRLLCLVVVGLTFLSLLPTEVFAFRLFRTGPTVDRIQPNPFTGGEQADPTALPPFTHWDHRRFAVGFEIPYALIDGTADVPGLDEFGAIDAAFQRWEDVSPAIINFVRTFYLGPAPPPRPFRRDNWNVLSWTGDAGDDVQVIPVGQSQPNSVIIDSGADGIADTAAAGDDVQRIPVGQGEPNSVVITAGPNGVNDTPPAGDDQVVGNTINSGADGVCNTDVDEDGPDNILGTADDVDDVQVIPVGQSQPNSVIIDSGLDGIANTAAAGDDVQVIPVGQRQPNSVIITAGGDGWIETLPVGDDVYDGVGNNINSGPDGVADTSANNRFTLPLTVNDFLALTASFYDRDTGVIFESDILFNDAFDWRIKGNGAACDEDINVPPPGDFPGPGDTDWNGNGIQEWEADVQTVATHEIGHFIGLAHRALEGAFNNPANPIMEQFWRIGIGPTNGGWANHVLKADDMDGANFLYTPDLGDAPDPYPTKTHSNVQTGTLNGIPIYIPGNGAEHIFGWRPAAGASYQYEWLGDDIDNAADECEAKQVNRDLFDDGWLNYPPAIVEGQPFIVMVRVRTTRQVGRYAGDDRVEGNNIVDGGDATGETRAEGDDEQIVPVGGNVGVGMPVVGPGPNGRLDTRPNNAGYPLYLNVWFDWKPVDRVWAPDEREIWWEGGPGFTTASSANWRRRFYDGNDIELDFEVTPPVGTGCNETWVRFRLDWNENVFVDPPADIDIPRPDQNTGVKYAAQFGEVEDYPIHIDCAPPVGIYCLHAEAGLIDLTNPVSTFWQGLCPNETYGKRYYLSNWQDNGNHKLSRCDYIIIAYLETGYTEWYHVENVTVTLHVEKKPYYNESMYIEFEGDILNFPWYYPVCTQWKEVYPHYCNSYHLQQWYDNGDGYFGYCDQIILRNKCTGETAEYHIVEVAIDIIVTLRTPPSPPVGGYWLPVDKRTIATPPSTYFILTTIIAAAFILIKRRQKAGKHKN